LAAGLAATTGLVTGTLDAVLWFTDLAAVLEATFEAVAFEPVAFAAVFAVLCGIELLLFLEDLAEALAFLVSELRARFFDAPRLTAAAFRVALEVLDLRVFCDTACARNCHAPVRMFHGNP
jgi:hypothetical protein